MTKDVEVSKGSLLYCDEVSNEVIFASNRRIVIQYKDGMTKIDLPFKLLDLFGFSRLCSRLFRLDRVSLLYVDDENLVMLRQGVVFHYCRKTRRLTEAYRLAFTRNILADASAYAMSGIIVFGDYGRKGKKDGVCIYKSNDYGRSWERCFSFPVGLVKQVLTINWDFETRNFWVNTGDDVGECFFWRFDENFGLLERVGDGSLVYRAISAWVLPQRISWVTNDPFNGAGVYTLCLKSRELSCSERIDGSVWYSKVLSDGYVVLSTCAEDLAWESDDSVKILIADGYSDFQVVRQYSKDRYPKALFRFGIASFPQGVYSSDRLMINCEALENIDGKIMRVYLN